MNTSSVTAEDLSPADRHRQPRTAASSTGTFVDTRRRRLHRQRPGHRRRRPPTSAAGTRSRRRCCRATWSRSPVRIRSRCPDITAEPPVREGNDVVVHGTATNVARRLGVNAQLHPPGGGKFAGGVGSSGGAFLDIGARSAASSRPSADDAAARRTGPRGSPAWATNCRPRRRSTRRRRGRRARARGRPGRRRADADARRLRGRRRRPAGVGGCGAPYSPNEARTASRSLINQANAGQDLTITGVAQPGAGASLVTLIDSAGKTVTAPAFGGASWTSTVPSGSLAGLADGPIRVGSTFTPFGNGATVGGLVTQGHDGPQRRHGLRRQRRLHRGAERRAAQQRRHDQVHDRRL